MMIDQISVFVENRAGRLAEITELLGESGIDLRAASIADTADFGILRLIVADTEKAIAILKDAGYILKINRVLAVAIPDEPGSLARILRIFANEGLNVEYLYAFITKRSEGAYVVFRMEDNDKAALVLTKNGIRLAGSDDLCVL